MNCTRIYCLSDMEHIGITVFLTKKEVEQKNII